MFRLLLDLLRQEGGWSRVWVGLGMAIAMAGGGLIYYQAQQVGEGEANVWVDTNGGTCTWSATAVAYSDAAACGTLDAAWDAANANSQASTVRVKAGTYSAQTISGDRASTNIITFDEASGESVTIQEIISGSGETDGPDYVTYKNFKLDGGFTSHGDTTHTTLDYIDGGVFSLWGGSDYVITNGDWGPCASISSPSFAAGKCSAQSGFNNASSEITSSERVDGGACSGSCSINGVLIENNVIHDHVLYQVGDHYECIRMDDTGAADADSDPGVTTNLIVRRNWFYNCQLEAITGTGVGNGSIFENNWVSSNEPDYGCDPFTETCQGGAARNQSFGCPGHRVGGNATVIYRYNSALTSPVPDDSGGGNCQAASGSSTLVYGNIMSDDWANGCPGSGVTLSYNVYVNSGSTCSGTGEASMTGDPYVNNSTFASANWHLASDSSTPNNIVAAASLCEDIAGLVDKDEQDRPIDSNCDAGSDER